MYKKETLINIIDDICDAGGQNAEMIAENEDANGRGYDEDKANSLLAKMRTILLNNIDKLQ